MQIRNVLLGSLLAAGFIAVFYLLFMPSAPVIDLNLRIGQTLEDDLVVPVDIDIPYSEDVLAEIQSAVRGTVPVHLRYNREVWISTEETLRPVLLRLTQDSLFVAGILNELALMYEVGVFNLQDIRSEYQGEQVVLLSGDTSSDCQLFDLYETDDAHDVLMMNLSRWGLPDSERDLLISLLRSNLQPDDSSRSISQELAVSILSDIDTTIIAGSVLLKESEPVTERTLLYLRQLEAASVGFRGVPQTVALLVLILIIVSMIFFYVYAVMKETWSSANRFLLLGVIWIISLAATGILWIAMKETAGYPYATLITFGAAMTSIFFHRRHAVFLTFMFSLVLGIAHPHPFSVVIISSISGILAALTAWDVRKRSSIPTAIGLSSAGGAGVFVLLYILNTSLETSPMLECILGLLIAPVVGIGSASALLFLFERVFGVYTVLAIDEVNRTDHPLLKEMREVAPGTWSHSQIVSELAGRGAGAINAWESLASAGGFFHDIGKMRYPEYFIENQRNIQNPHDSMNPWESARKIIDHVRIGVELAQNAKLPNAVIDVIAQHHGTSLTKYFYNRALKNSQEMDSVKESDFRYPGPRPVTVEAALILLADQAASATKNLESPDDVGGVITRVVEEIDLDGELDDCHLSRRNLKTIISVFTSVMENKFYQRVKDYPTGDLNEY